MSTNFLITPHMRTKEGSTKIVNFTRAPSPGQGSCAERGLKSYMYIVKMQIIHFFTHLRLYSGA